MIKMRTYSCLIWAHVFTLFAAFQYNDPDPHVWIPIYMLLAILSVITIFRPIHKIILGIILLFYIAGSAFMFPAEFEGISMPMNQRVPAIEEARESLGLLIGAIAVGWLLFLSFLPRRVSA